MITISVYAIVEGFFVAVLFGVGAMILCLWGLSIFSTAFGVRGLDCLNGTVLLDIKPALVLE